MKQFRTGVGKRYGRRHTPGEMNATESRYAAILQLRLLAREIHAWHFEAITFKLAADLRYTPDFCVLHLDGAFELIDVKGTGPIDDKSIVKIKAAAERFYRFDWTMAIQQTVKNGGGFQRREF